ncbi:hypothetical protein [Sciscionella marina]|uniref:hypothetical protein n=1 Tax=Sciscionella marina TaxID=508770 RepID=UPI000475BFAF|nr:hypothetical protein [Sciscionella marina]
MSSRVRQRVSGTRRWRTIQPHVRSYFLPEASGHTSPQDVVDQHRLLLDVLHEGRLDRMDIAVENHVQLFLDTEGRNV